MSKVSMLEEGQQPWMLNALCFLLERVTKLEKVMVHWGFPRTGGVAILWMPWAVSVSTGTRMVPGKLILIWVHISINQRAGEKQKTKPRANSMNHLIIKDPAQAALLSAPWLWPNLFLKERQTTAFRVVFFQWQRISELYVFFKKLRQPTALEYCCLVFCVLNYFLQEFHWHTDRCKFLNRYRK